MGEIKLGEYLLERLAQLGTLTVQGVPGDFNMGFLDMIEDHGKLRWCGNANELNAAYSADGYARTKKVPAAVVTTFGVGELSAFNGIAGAFAEHVPVVNITGVPATSAQKSRSLLHHTLGDGNFDTFQKMASHIHAADLKLADVRPELAPQEIDRILEICVRRARPVYISLPTDLVYSKVSDERLREPIDTSTPQNDSDLESTVLNEILSRVRKAQDPIILVDACAIRHFVVPETHELVDKSGLPVFSSPMGKTAIDEQHRQYGGIYVGNLTPPRIQSRVEKADCVISVGALLSDFNTGSFSYSLPKHSTIELHSDHVQVGYARYDGVAMKPLIPKIAEALAADRDTRLERTLATIPRMSNNKLPSPEEEQESLGSAQQYDASIISQAWFWPRVGQFFRKGDQVICETGTSSFGMLDAQFPSGASFEAQVLWGSIGWSVGATLGVALAAREDKLGKVCLFVGDGSLQLTVQEVGTMIREGLGPILFVLSNDGYEIERQIHGPQRSYNDIQPYNHKLLLDFFNGSRHADAQGARSHEHDGPSPRETRYHAVKTKQELDTLLNDEAFAKAPSQGIVQLVEVFMKRGDAPRALRQQAAATSNANSY